MSINIIDGFYVGNSTPIDNRFVVASVTDRDNIVYKYDGLKVFVQSNRITYIWNSSLSSWSDEQSGNISGYGISNNIPLWTGSSSLGTSSIYFLNNKIGLNNSTPKSSIDMNDPLGSEPISLNIRRINSNLDSAVLSYNWYYNNGDKSHNYLKQSTKIEMGCSGSLSIQTTPSLFYTPFSTIFELNNSNGFNYLRNIGNGNFISGTLSISTSSVPYTTTHLFTVDGTMRTNSSLYEKVTYLIFNGTQFSKQDGYKSNGVISSMYNLPNSGTYSILSDDNNLLIKTTTLTDFNLLLPSIPMNSLECGRKININFGLSSLTYSTNRMNITGTNLIVGVDGIVNSVSMIPGESIELISFLDNTTPKWKVIDYKKILLDEQWVTIGSSGYFQNGESIPTFNYTCSNSASPMQVRKTKDGKVAIRGFIVLSNPWVSTQVLFTLPVGYRPLVDVFLSISSIGNISVRSNGDLLIDGYSGATNIVLPEIQFSLD